ncbi:MAG: hypothetical protein WC558_11475 [Patulibacter sp.]
MRYRSLPEFATTRYPRRRSVALSVGAAFATAALAPAAAGAATPFDVAPGGHDQTVVTLSGGTSYVAYRRPSSANPDVESVGVCRVFAGASSCATNVELPFPGPTGSGPEAVGRAHVASNDTGGISVYANCFFCLGDVSSTAHAVVWTSTDGVTFVQTTLNGSTIFDGDGTGALVTTSVGGAFVQASSGSGSGRGVVQPLVLGSLPAPADLSSAYIGYRSSVVRGVGNSMVYATSDLDRIRSRSFMPFMGPTSVPTPGQIANTASWSPLTEVASPEAEGVDALSLARTPNDVYLGYRHREAGVSSVLYRRFDWTPGVTQFGPAMPLHPVSGLDTDTDEPAIAGDPAGRVHAIWQASNSDTRRLRYAVTDAAGNAPTILGNLATGEWFVDTQLDAGAGGSGLATWRGVSGEPQEPLRAVSLDPKPEPTTGGGGNPGGGGVGGGGGGGAVIPPPVKRKTPSKEVKTSVSVPGGTLSLGVPRGCVKPKATYTVRMSFVAKKRGSRRSNVVVKVTRADFYVNDKRKAQDRKAPFAARLKVTSKAGKSIKVRGVARLKVKKTSKPRTRTIKTTLKVCR